jgi:hypothetical protein
VQVALCFNGVKTLNNGSKFAVYPVHTNGSQQTTDIRIVVALVCRHESCGCFECS